MNPQSGEVVRFEGNIAPPGHVMISDRVAAILAEGKDALAKKAEKRGRTFEQEVVRRAKIERRRRIAGFR